MLKLFGETVIVKLKQGSSAFNNYGKEIRGRLVGRTWGEKLIVNDLTGKEESLQTVIAITIQREGIEIGIKADDIEDNAMIQIYKPNFLNLRFIRI